MTPAGARGKKNPLVITPDRRHRWPGATEHEPALLQTWQRRMEMESSLLEGCRRLSQNRPGGGEMRPPPGGSEESTATRPMVDTLDRHRQRRMTVCRAPRGSWLLFCRQVATGRVEGEMGAHPALPAAAHSQTPCGTTVVHSGCGPAASVPEVLLRLRYSGTWEPAVVAALHSPPFLGP